MRAVAQLFSPAGRRASLLVLIYHRVLAEFDPLMPAEPDATRFAAQMDLLSDLFNVLPLTEAVARLKSGSLPARAVCITFDDGYVNNLAVATPILRARGLPATVFVATGFIDGSCMWNDILIEVVRSATDHLDLTSFGLGVYTLEDMPARRQAVDAILQGIKYLDPVTRLDRVRRIADHAKCVPPIGLMLSEAQVRQLHAAGIQIGAHTVTHPILTAINDDAARREIMESRRCLESLIGAPVKYFAYPNGRPQQDYASRHVLQVKQCGFDGAVSTAWGASHSESDAWQLPRIAPWDQSSLMWTGRIVKSYADAAALTV
jgi:peptidoglycan/xylan/chitin deacetylase (PgdA/CDA1 family)